MTNEEKEKLLKEAKEKYPIGTKFIACNTNKECIITTNNLKYSDINSINEFDSSGFYSQTSGVYHCLRTNNGIWAEIINKPEIVKDKLLKFSGNISHLDQAIEVQSSEGGIYKVGDKISIINTKNPAFRNKQYFTILGFRQNNDKTKICAIFNKNFPNGIGLDKIQLYVEPKKVEFVLPEKYCVRHHKEVVDYIIYLEGNNNGCYVSDISLYSHFPKHYDCFGKAYCSRRIIDGYIEISIEQFKKYVLNNGK